MDIQLPGNRSVTKHASLASAGGTVGWVGRAFRALVLFAAAGLLVEPGVAQSKKAAAGKDADTFMPYVQLAPFVVNGKQLAISIHARSGKDRRYAETFAEEVVKVVYEGVTPE